MERERMLLSLAVGDEPSVQSAMAGRDAPPLGLDPRTHALVRLAAIVALDGAPASYACSVDAALAAGATTDEIVDTLLAVAPLIGSARVVSAAPSLAGAIGYEVDTAFERG